MPGAWPAAEVARGAPRHALLDQDQLVGTADELYSTDAAHRRNAGRLMADHVLSVLLKNAVNEHVRQHGRRR